MFLESPSNVDDYSISRTNVPVNTFLFFSQKKFTKKVNKKPSGDLNDKTWLPGGHHSPIFRILVFTSIQHQ